MAEQTLTGLWHGLYAYPWGAGPVPFTATLIEWGAGFSGSCDEVAADDAGIEARRRSEVWGRREGATILFDKRYDGRRGWDHVVAYRGTLSEDGGRIGGTWDIPGVWSGRFVMGRGALGRARALRRAFETA